jgi:xanthine/uracil permease
MLAMLLQIMPKDIVPQIIEPLVCNGFAMGVIMVILLEHLINRAPKPQNGDKVS